MTAAPCMLCTEMIDSLDEMQRHVTEQHDPAELMAWIAIHLPATSEVVDRLIAQDKEPEAEMPAILRAMAEDMERRDAP